MPSGPTSRDPRASRAPPDRGQDGVDLPAQLGRPAPARRPTAGLPPPPAEVRAAPSAVTAPSPSWAAVAACGVAAAAVTAGVVVLILRDAPADDRVVSAIVHGLTVVVAVAIGLAEYVRNPGDRFARLLVAAGLFWSTTALAESSDPTAYSLGRVAVWLVDVGIVYLILAFPAGRLATRPERAVFTAVVLIALLLYVPTALVVDEYPVPSPYSSCGQDCPHNALALTGSEPGVVDGLIRPVREVLTCLVFLATAWIVVRRAAFAGPLLRRAVIPVAAIAAYRAAAYGVYAAVRLADPSAGVLDVVGELYLLSLPLVAVGFGVGLLLRQVHAAIALQRLALRLRPSAGAAELRTALARVLEDPSLRVLSWRDGWVDEAGRPAPLPAASPGLQVTELRSGDRPAAALVQDGTLNHDPAVLRAAAAYALLVVENGRLVEQLRASLAQLTRSRARLAAIADETRRAIERDIHDGAQQRLIALRIQLSMQAKGLEADDPARAAALEGLGTDVERAIDDLRSLAHGVYPAVLTEHGLPAALRAVARAATIPTTVSANGVGRYETDVENSVYFACVEALQNAEKHATGAGRVEIRLTAGEDLVFEVCDDGGGYDVDEPGNEGALDGLRDRLGAAGGTLTVTSALGRGTCVTGRVPI